MIYFQVPFAFLTVLNQSGYLTQIKCLIQNLHPTPPLGPVFYPHYPSFYISNSCPP